MSRDRDVNERPPDVEIGATARARSIRFRQVPDVEVEFPGEATEGESASERENLPDRVEPGVTYRNAGVRWVASARIEDPDAD